MPKCTRIADDFVGESIRAEGDSGGAGRSDAREQAIEPRDAGRVDRRFTTRRPVSVGDRLRPSYGSERPTGRTTRLARIGAGRYAIGFVLWRKGRGMRTRVAGVFLAWVMLAGCGGGGGETAREGPTNERAESGSERTFSGTVPEGVTVGRTMVDRPSPEERGRSEARLLECQIEEAEGDLGREGLGALVGEMADDLVERPDADFGQLLAERGYTCGRLVAP
jgi:hypothetical protein